MINDPLLPIEIRSHFNFNNKTSFTSISGTVNLDIIVGGGNIIDKHRRSKFCWRLSIVFDGSIEFNEYTSLSGELSLGDDKGLSKRFLTSK
jgi:hypothetical protein